MKHSHIEWVSMKVALSMVIAMAIFFAWTTTVFAETAAEGDQTFSSRTSLVLEGGYPETVVVGSSAVEGANNMLYAGLNSPNGMFWSNDFGETWNGMAGDADVGSVIDVAVSDTPGTAFMIAGISLYRTQDSGVTWEQLSEVQNVAQFFAAGSDGLLAVPTRDGQVYVSTDDGDTFTSYDLNVSGIAVTGNNTVFALVSEEGSETRTVNFLTTEQSEFFESSESGEYSIIMAHPTEPNYILVAGADAVRYSTGGTYQGMVVPEGVTTGASVIRANGDIYLGNEVSSDNGATWTEASGWNWITFDDVNGYVYSASTRGVGRATSADGPFVDKVIGMTGVTISDIAQDTTKEIVWLAVQGGYARTENYLTATNAGEEPIWEYPITTGGPDGSGIAVWVDQTDSDHVVVSGGGLSYSTNGGDSWTDAITDVDEASVGEIEDWDGTLYAAYTTNDGGGGVLQSTNGGVNWTDTGMPSAPVQSLVAANGIVVAGVGSEQDSTASKRGLYRYNDSSWTQITTDEEGVLYGAIVNDLLLTADASVVAITSGADLPGVIAISKDSGATWSTLGSDDIPSDFWGQGLALSTVDDDQIFASTARPSGTGYIYTCSISKDSCGVYYTGLVDEAFNAMLFDGLITGSNVGLFSYEGKATLAIKKLKNKKKKQRITVILKDKATAKKLNGRTIKLYRKKLGAKKFKFFKKAKMKKGKVVFKFKKKLKGTYRAKWGVGGTDKGIYESKRSKTVKFKKKK